MSPAAQNVRFQGLSSNGGMSLVELMIVVGIIGVLGTIVNVKYQQFTVRAKMTEAKTNLRSIYAMYTSYRLRDGLLTRNPGSWSGYDAESCSKDTTNGSNYYCYLTNFQTPPDGAYNVDNPLNYQAGNPEKARYGYRVIQRDNPPGAGTDVGKWAVRAGAIGSKVFANVQALLGLASEPNYSQVTDKWLINSCKQVCHIRNVFLTQSGGMTPGTACGPNGWYDWWADGECID